jgi:hypothetical protein
MRLRGEGRETEWGRIGVGEDCEIEANELFEPYGGYLLIKETYEYGDMK